VTVATGQRPDLGECVTVHSRSEDDTRAFGARVAGALRGGDLLGLRGDLGSGKTCFVRGLADGLGIAAHKVRSPTFTLVNEYGGGRLPLYHIDLYRLNPSPVDRLALREYLDGYGVCAVEWFERLGEAAPHLDVAFTYVSTDEREIVVRADGSRYKAVLTHLRSGY